MSQNANSFDNLFFNSPFSNYIWSNIFLNFRWNRHYLFLKFENYLYGTPLKAQYSITIIDLFNRYFKYKNLYLFSWLWLFTFFERSLFNINHFKRWSYTLCHFTWFILTTYHHHTEMTAKPLCKDRVSFVSLFIIFSTFTLIHWISTIQCNLDAESFRRNNSTPALLRVKKLLANFHTDLKWIMVHTLIMVIINIDLINPTFDEKIWFMLHINNVIITND